ncbi:MAG: hypothetical protein QW196_00345 [Sulfolobales archaeon]
MRKAFEFFLGLASGFAFSFFFLYLLFSEDELQRQASRKALLGECERLREELVVASPEEKERMLKDYQRLLNSCEKLWREEG